CCPLANKGADIVQRSVDDRLDSTAGRKVLDASADERYRIRRGQLSRLEAHPGGAQIVHAIHTKTAPVVATEVVCNQVPAAPQRDQSVRLDVAHAALGVLCGITEAQP